MKSIIRRRIADAFTPSASSWVSVHTPPPWLRALDPGVRRVRRVGRKTRLALIEVPSVDAAEAALAALPETNANILLLVGAAVDTSAEVRLLEGGASAVLDARSERSCVARVRPWLGQRRRALPLGVKGPAAERAPSTTRRHHALEVASHLLGTMMDVDETFQRLVEILASELESSRVSLMRVDRDLGILEMQAAVGVPPEVMARARAKIGEGIAGTCARLGQPLFVDDHARVRAGNTDMTEFLPGAHGERGAPMSLTVPILVKGEVVGVVNITDRVGDTPYSPADISFASSLMAHAGYLLENAGLIAHIDGLRGFLERVLDAIEDPLAVVDGQWQVVSGNRAFFERFAASTGQSLAEAVGAQPAQIEKLEQLVEARDSALTDWVLGDWTFDMSVTEVAGGEAGRKVVLFHDVTGRRQMERRLVSAEKMASLGVLSAGVAHEINNPMTFVKSNTLHAGEYFADLLEALDAWRSAAQGASTCEAAAELEDTLGIEHIREDVKGMVQETAEGVERVQRIVASLKGFAHPDTSSTYEAELPVLIENAVLLTQGQWKYKLEIVRDFDDVPPVYCLPTQLEQVFMNLITNAAQAASEHGVLAIRVRAHEHGVRIEFADDCGGIPTHIVDRIFEPFFTTKDIGQGTGLGLSISYNIIEGHGGQLSVSRSAGGTTFVVDLPMGVAGRPLVVQQHSRFRA